MGNQLLKQLRCLNPTKRNDESTTPSIQNLASILQPKISETGVIDEWKLFQVDNWLPTYKPTDRIEVFWNQVFKIQSATGKCRYKLLPLLIKSALTLAQANADSECSLSVNTQIVTEDRASLGEKTIVGLCVLREAVQFCDPVGHRPELLKISPALKQAVKSSHASYKKQREREKEIRKKKEEEELRQKEFSEKQEKERSRLLKKESLAKSEEDLSQQEKCAREEVRAADELLQDAKLKLDNALESNTISKEQYYSCKDDVGDCNNKAKRSYGEAR